MSAIAIVGAFFIGAILGAARAHRIPVVSQIAAVYVEVIRNTPILVQIFFLFFALPELGVRLQTFTVAWLSVMIWGGAFNTENWRAGFEAVPYRFREAGLALGFSRLATFFNVTLPIGGRCVRASPRIPCRHGALVGLCPALMVPGGGRRGGPAIVAPASSLIKTLSQEVSPWPRSSIVRPEKLRILAVTGIDSKSIKVSRSMES